MTAPAKCTCPPEAAGEPCHRAECPLGAFFSPPLIDRTNGVSVLACPKCCGAFLHHGAVVVIARPREDGPATRIAIAPDAGVEAGPAEDAPGRRNALSIAFDCEECGPAGSLWIIQHKGSTILEWEAP